MKSSIRSEAQKIMDMSKDKEIYRASVKLKNGLLEKKSQNLLISIFCIMTDGKSRLHTVCSAQWDI